MRKSILIGVIVAVLALGAIGAAFANNLGFGSSVGALATGTKYLPNVNVDGVVWGVESDAPPTVSYVKLSFDCDLGAGTELAVDVLGSGGTLLRHVWVGDFGSLLASALSDKSKIRLDNPTPLLVSDIYGIRVTVSEETGP